MISAKQLFGETGQSTIEYPLAHLNACHRRIEHRLETLERAGQVLQAQPEEALAAIRKALDFLEETGGRHTADEEESVFPRLCAKVLPEERQLLGDLEEEHVEAAGIAAQLKAVVAEMGGAVTEENRERYLFLVHRLAAHYRRHIRDEEAILARIGRVLSAEELAAISQEMKVRRGL